MISFRYKPEPPHGSPDFDGEAELGKSYEELQDEYYDYLDDEIKESETRCNS